MMNERILIVDDEERAREILADHLEPAGYEIVQAADGEQALARVKDNELNLMLLDLMLPDISGLDVLKQAVKLKPALPVIMISGQGTIETAVQATKLGAYDFLVKPVERERILLAVRNALERDQMRREVTLLKEEALSRYRMVGVSEPMQKIMRLIEEIASSRVPVLVTGESGGGKELVARAIHLRGDRKDRPFVKLNCAAIPENLIESELFGYEKGAFTGALNQKKGKLELAYNGTLFLDEVGDLSLSSQAKLLRFLQEAEFERVGGTAVLKVDVRIISATNKDLNEEIRQKHFRDDLFYRLNVIHIHVPPLRDRKDDIPALADFFLEKQCEENGVPKKTLTPQATEFLRGLSWERNNIRELENLIKRASILVKSQEIAPRDLSEVMETSAKTMAVEKKTLKEATDEFQREHIRRLLAENNGDKSKTAKELDIERAHLYRKMKDLGLPI
jgi:two-component system nitrogen regulation response regulator NtrX